MNILSLLSEEVYMILSISNLYMYLPIEVSDSWRYQIGAFIPLN